MCFKSADISAARPCQGLGVDIGGVIIHRANNDGDTSFFGDDYLRTPPVPGSIEVLRALVKEPFGECVYLVSKCGQRVRWKRRLSATLFMSFFGICAVCFVLVR